MTSHAFTTTLRLTVSAVAVLAISACQPASQTPPALTSGLPAPAQAGAQQTGSRQGAADADPAARAQAAAKDFSGRLQSALRHRMADGGPVAAIDFCQQQAPRIAEAVATEHGVRLGRVAVPGRQRNPGNIASGWQADALAALQAQHAEGSAAGELAWRQSDGLPQDVSLRMMRGIEVQSGCLACHGTQLAEPVRQAIARHYPDDAATGFSAGDLRGALWLEVPRP